MGKDVIAGQMVENMKVNIMKMLNMELVLIYGPMEQDIKELG
jgi:hypothetical protein